MDEGLPLKRAFPLQPFRLQEEQDKGKWIMSRKTTRSNEEKERLEAARTKRVP